MSAADRTTSTPVPSQVLARFGHAHAALTPILRGNINRTFLVEEDGARFVLQRVNPIFQPTVHYDIAAVTAHLQRHGLNTPRLCPTLDDALWTNDAEGGVWRLMTFIPGHTHDQAGHPDVPRAAGAWLGRFHRTLSDLQHEFLAKRLGVHDTARHQARLQAALAREAAHPGRAQAQALGGEILAALAKLPSLTGLPERVVHGDPKLNNFIFAPNGEVVALCDLDTVAKMPVPLELGDAFRSWCNPLGEDTTATRFELDLLAAGLEGYAGACKGWLTAAERDAIVVAIETITLELAARFCTDIIEESYFGWDRARYNAAWQHHAERAEGQLRLAQSFAQQRSAAQALVQRLF
jgi:Ser/Thr protein kinase RdoA (MazF antagonist)